MTALPQRFPAKKISSRRLMALADKARAAHATAQSAPAAPASPKRTRPAAPREGLRIGGLTWLELSAIAATLLLGVLLAARWLPSHATQNRSAQNETAPVEEKSASNRVGEEGVKTPEEKPKPEPKPTPDDGGLPALVKDLSSEDFDVRESAEKRLKALDHVHLAEVEKFMKDADDTEVKTRLKRIADDMRDRASIEAFLLDREHNDIFGQRFNDLRATMVRRYGGDERTEDAVERAVKWLAYHQEADGHWDTVKYSSQVDADLPATAFAVMALMAAGNNETFGKFKDNVKRGIAWLISCQQKSGVYMKLGQATTTTGYQHAIAAIAVTEAAAMSKEAATVKSAQKALTYSVDVHQAADGGWRYQPGGKDSDLSITSWFMQQLKLAQYVPLKVPDESLKRAFEFIDRCQPNGKEKQHLYAYTPGGQAMPAMTAAGCLDHQLFGGKREDLQKGVDAFIAQGGVPAWGDGGKSVELYYWYYGTLSAFQQGGEAWKKWNTALKNALVDNQLKQGDESGMWSNQSGRMASMGFVGQTAVAALCLEVYYRYPKFDELGKK